MDCEMVGVTSQGNKSALGRVTLVNKWGNVIYDEFVRPVERVVDFRTQISGIRPRDMRKAKDFRAVQKKVAELITGKVLVGHALRNDFKALLLSHPKDIRDTSEYPPFLKESHRKALSWITKSSLTMSISEDALSERLASQSPPLTGEGDSSTSDVDHTKLFLDIEGVNKKKKVYELGSAAAAYVDTAGSKVIANSSSSRSQQNEEEVDRLVQQNNQMSDKVAELEAQVVEQNKHLAESEKRMSEKMNELAEHNKQMAELMKKMIPTPAPAP